MATILLGVGLIGCGGGNGTGSGGSSGGGTGGGSGSGGSSGGSGGGSGGIEYPTNRIGQITLLEMEGVASVAAWLATAPSVPPEQRIASAGDCALYTHPEPGSCAPACDGFCQPSGACTPFPGPASAGPITVTGLRQPLTFQPMAYGYVPSLESPPANLFDPGVVIDASAPGGGGLVAFTIRARGVAPLEADLQNLVLEDDQDEIIRWTAGPGTSQARIQLALRVGWHGAPYEMMLLCETADDGELVIDKQLIAQMPSFGGVGLFPWPSEIVRFTRGLANTSQGPIELLVGSYVSVFWTHNADAL